MQSYMLNKNPIPVPASATFQLSLLNIVAKANIALLENGLRFESIHQERAMSILLKIFEDQVAEQELTSPDLTGLNITRVFCEPFTDQTSTDLDRLYLSIAQLSIQVMYLFQSASNVDLASRSRLYTTACAVIDKVSKLDRTQALVHYATMYIYLAVLIAACVLLRLYKTTFSKYLDLESCKATFFSAINILRKLSLENNDTPAKAAIMLSQLWTSNKVFRNADGSERSELRIKSFLEKSSVFDCVLWWKEEFRSDPVVASVQLGDRHYAAMDVASEKVPTDTFLPVPAMDDRADEELAFELGWALSDPFGLESISLPFG